MSMNFGDLIVAVLEMLPGSIVHAKQKRCSVCDGHNVDCHFCFSTKAEFDIKEVDGQKVAEA